MILIFDLDDTLYQEELYALSGFKAVADYISDTYKVVSEESFGTLISALKSGERDQAFQKLIQKWGLPQSAVHKCLSVYRNHIPNIHLAKEAEEVLRIYSKVNKYVVTDGNKIVQKRKIDALKLNSIFNRCLITHNFGLKAAKPSTFCFDKIRTIEVATWQDLVYVGDDPTKDFVNLKPLGVKTVRVMTGRHAKIEVPSELEAEIRIPSLIHLKDALQS
jgi:putative hydrolase of the HAD superfamily